MEKAALLSVSDRTGIVDLASELSNLGYKLLTTTGTGKLLDQHSISHLPIEQYTNQKEILDGRVKTLHPKIHAGLLAKRSDPTHMAELAQSGFLPIEVVVVNLYPFSQKLETDTVQTPDKMIEFIDVGGPTMLRAASKNFNSVFVLSDPADYSAVIECIKSGRAASPEGLELRRDLAVKVFTLLAQDNLEVARYFSSVSVQEQRLGLNSSPGSLAVTAGVSGIVARRSQDLRYGENPNQAAALYREYSVVGGRERSWTQLSGKELSYNNLLDIDACIRIVRDFERASFFSVIIKHLNPCGAAFGSSALDALKRAKLCDPRSHFGGIIGFNKVVDKAVAENIREDFTEIVVAPNFNSEALELLNKNKNLRLIKLDLNAPALKFELRTIEGGILVQERDQSSSSIGQAELVAGSALDQKGLEDLELAWKLCSHVKSNAITLAKDGLLIGAGAGQMSRIDSIELSISKARFHGHDLKNAVCASDAFFPFSDSLEALAKQGVRAVISPRGAKRDDEVVQAAKKLGLSLYFVNDRHFRH